MKIILSLLISLAAHAVPNVQVQPTLETDAVSSSGDAADDTTVWVHPSQPEKSLIVGVDKLKGVILYDLQGKRISEFAVGRINNIDSRAGFVTAKGPVHLLAGSNRSTGRIDFYTIDPSNYWLSTVGSIDLGYEPYGICAGFLPSMGEDQLSVFVTTKDGKIDHWIVQDQQGLKAKRKQTLKVSSTVEGCALNEETGDLFVGEEARGLWRFELENGNARSLVDRVRFDGGNLVADVEGVALYQRPGHPGYLLVSSQGDNSFHIYSLSDFSHRGRFQIKSANGIDEVSDTDGIDITSLGLNAQFPNGFLVAQDGSNGVGMNQNFKVVDWNEIKSQIQKFDPNFDR